jgi:hypothetical protein
VHAILGIRRRRFLVGSLGLVAVVTACQGPTYNPPSGSNTTPSNLAVEVLAGETAQQLAPGSPSSSLDVSIYFDLNGQSGVQFNQGETVTCGGANLDFILGRYHSTLSGWSNPLICTYTRNGTSTQMSIPIAQLPLPTYPTVNTSVARSPNLVITYSPVTDSVGVRVRTDANTAPDSAFQPETGSILYDSQQQTLGPSVLTLERRVKASPSSGFKSLAITSDSDVSVLIKWA